MRKDSVPKPTARPDAGSENGCAGAAGSWDRLRPDGLLHGGRAPEAVYDRVGWHGVIAAIVVVIVATVGFVALVETIFG